MTAAARARLAKVAWLQEAHRFSELGYMLFGDLWLRMYFCMHFRGGGTMTYQERRISLN